MPGLRTFAIGLSTAALLAGAAAAQPMPELHFTVNSPGLDSRRLDSHAAPDEVQFTITYGGGGYHMDSEGRRLSDLTGLTQAQLAAGGPVRFRLSRDAGDLACDGVASHGEAVGACSFAAKPAFAHLLAERGMGQASDEQLFRMALHDVGVDYLDELRREGYATPSVGDLARAGEHGVRIAYLQGLAAEGYRGGRLDEVTLARDHGVTPASVQELRQAGYANLTLADLVRLRDHGVNGAWLKAMADAGFTGFPADTLAHLRDHGVSGDWLKGVAAAGYRDLPADSLARLRDHGVNGEWLADLRQAGYAGLSPSLAIRMRDMGVTGEFARRALAELGEKPSAEELIRLRVRGFVRRADYPSPRQ